MKLKWHCLCTFFTSVRGSNSADDFQWKRKTKKKPRKEMKRKKPSSVQYDCGKMYKRTHRMQVCNEFNIQQNAFIYLKPNKSQMQFILLQIPYTDPQAKSEHQHHKLNTYQNGITTIRTEHTEKRRKKKTTSTNVMLTFSSLRFLFWHLARV